MRGPVVIRLADKGVLMNGARCAIPEGAYLKSFDHDANGGGGEVVWTTDPAEALIFEKAGEAFGAYTGTSRVRPKRSDGLPNRPMTAFTVTIDDAP